jgi:preprotein translocase subunit SecF
VIHFFRQRKIYFIISILFIITGIVFTFINGIQLDIQFKGGTILKYTHTGDIDLARLTRLYLRRFPRQSPASCRQTLQKGRRRLL